MRLKIRCDGESCKIFGILKEVNTAFIYLSTVKEIKPVVTVGRSFGWGQKWHCGRVH
jgi:hypothetical protein